MLYERCFCVFWGSVVGRKGCLVLLSVCNEPKEAEVFEALHSGICGAGRLNKLHQNSSFYIKMCNFVRDNL